LVQNFSTLSTTKDNGGIWRYNFEVLYKEPKMTAAIRIANYAGSVMRKVWEEKWMPKSPVCKICGKRKVERPKQDGCMKLMGMRKRDKNMGVEELENWREHLLEAKTVDGL
jgi:hypothetical protein